MRSRIVRAIFAKELLETLRDRRTLFAMIVLPVLLQPLLMLDQFGKQLFLCLRPLGKILFQFKLACFELRRLFFRGFPAGRLGGQCLTQRLDPFGHARVLTLQFHQRRLRGF